MISQTATTEFSNLLPQGEKRIYYFIVAQNDKE